MSGQPDEFEAGIGLSGAAHQSAEEIVGRYDEWAIEYETDVRSWGYTLPEDIATMTMARSPVGRILDAGCGTGLIGHALVEHGATAGQLLGVDASHASLAIAADSGIYTDVSRVDLAAGLPFDDHSFGAVVCGGVLTYIPEAAPVLREFVRVLRPGAAAIVSQRTDLWVERNFDETLGQLRVQGVQVEISDRVPYLPDLAEYGEEIEVIFTTLIAPR
jgi:ubiquinone/menaquinone biosynthesis C-methylase UbiE